MIKLHERFLSVISLPALLVLLALPQYGRSQFVINENFDTNPGGGGTIPLGWNSGVYGSSSSINNSWIMNAATFTFPTWSPRSGAAMMQYQSHSVTAGEAAFLATKKLDMRTIPGAGAVVSLWMMRDSIDFLANTDRISVWVNSTPDMSGSPVQLTETVTGATQIHRSTSLAPVPVTKHNWNQYSYTIPSTWNTANVYVIFLATSALGNNIYIDDVTINTYPKAANQSFVSSTAAVINQNTVNCPIGGTGQQIIGVRFQLDGNNIPRVLTNMEFNTNGTTNATHDIVNAKLWYTRGTPTFATNNAIFIGTYTSPWLTNYTFLQANANYTGPANLTNLDHGENYFWITYDIAGNAFTGNFVDAEWLSFTLSGATSTPTVFTLTGSRLISGIYSYPTSILGTTFWGTGSDYIQRVVLQGDLVLGIDNNMNWVYNNTPGCPGPYPRACGWQSHPPDYEFFNAVPGKTTTLTSNGSSTYAISLQVGSVWPLFNFIAAWIDYNQNGTFEPSEKIAQSGSLGSNGTLNTTFTVPATALTGQTRLRVRESFLGSNMDSQSPALFGETEDYPLTITPGCALTPGWTTWLGFTNDWNDNNNWCPPKAPVSGNVPDVNVRIPGGPSFTGYDYQRPVIANGVNARAIKLRIESPDTVYINAPYTGSLVILDSLSIRAAASALVIKSIFRDTANIDNGALNRPSESPLNNSERSRAFMLYTNAELLAKGMLGGDTVTNLLLHIQRKSNLNDYKNFTVRYYYTGPTFSFTPGSAGVIPAQVGPAPQVIYSSNLNVASIIPSVNGWGTIDLALTTPLIWSGSTNQLVLEICYDNSGFGLTGSNDEIRFTQTTSFRKYMNIENLSNYPKAGCDMLPSDVSLVTSSGTAGNTVITVSAAQASLVYMGALVVGSGPANGNVNGVVMAINGNLITLSSAPLATFTNGTLTFFNANNTASIYRPNVTFKFSRPFFKYPITVSGHWGNNGFFSAGNSKVTMNGTLTQQINGANNTTFYDLQIQNANHLIRMKDFTVTDSLQLTNGRLKLNNGTVTLTNPSPSALTYVLNAGDIQAEMDAIASNVAPYGRLAWNMGSTPGMRTIPFINIAGVRIPMNYSIDSGTHDVMLGTYATVANNSNWPLPEVTNIQGVNNATGGGWGANGWGMVDRYYLAQNLASGGGQADITFRYAVTEQAQSGNSLMKAQRWLHTSSLWEFPFQPVQNFTAGNPNTVTVFDYNGFGSGNWWTIVGEASPLPVSLLEFNARKKELRVKLSWSTASEINSSHFVVERTVDNENFDFIGRVESKGPGTNKQNYETWDNSPLDGVQFYYLRQFDRDGAVENYGPVSVKFSKNIFEIVAAVSSSSEEGMTVVFNYNSKEPYSYRVIDMTGRVVAAKDKNSAVEGLNVIDIDFKLATGIYQVFLQNSTDVVSHKFFY